MKFPFNERKAAQAAAYLLRKHGGAHDYGCTIKLLYLADRQALIEDGTPITGDDMWLMTNGPVLENVKNCMNGHRGAGREWRHYVTQRDEGNRVYLVGDDPSVSELSEREMEILDTVDAAHGSKTWDEIVDYCHSQLPEWETVARGKRKTLLPEKLLHVAHVPQERVNEIQAHALLMTRAAEIGGRTS